MPRTNEESLISWTTKTPLIMISLLATADSSALKRLKATRKSLTAPSLLLCSSCSQVLEARDTCRSLVCCRERWITFFLLPSGSWEMCFFHLLPLGSGVLDTALARRLDFQANTGNRFASSCKMSVIREGPPGRACTSSAQFTTQGYPPPPPPSAGTTKMKVCS